MSLLMGPAFAVSYILFGILFGRLTDSKSRRTIIAMGFVAWSLFTAGCGVAKTYLQMFWLRVGVGIGEASLSPAAYSLITDYFPPKRRATAISVYGMGIYIGSGLAFIVGGAVTEMVIKQGAWQLPLVGATRSWQVVFFIVGLPGVLLSLLLYTVREPLRRGARMIKTASGTTQVAQAPLGEVLAYLRDEQTDFPLPQRGIRATLFLQLRNERVDSHFLPAKSRLEHRQVGSGLRLDCHDLRDARHSRRRTVR